MQASVENHGEITVVSLSGRIDHESVPNFEKVGLERFTAGKVVFDLKDLSFVGSTGIKPFLGTLGRIVEKASEQEPRFVGVSSEFQKLFQTGGLEQAQVYSDMLLAFNSFYFDSHQISFVGE